MFSTTLSGKPPYSPFVKWGEGVCFTSGGRVAKGKFPIGECGFASLVFDTEGNMIGLHSMK